MNESEEQNLSRSSSSNSKDHKPEQKKQSLPLVNQNLESSSNLSQTQQFSELEWDQELDFVRKAESDTLSTYDLNERIQELLKQRILEFEMVSNGESFKNLSSIDGSESDLKSLSKPDGPRYNISLLSAVDTSSIDHSSAASLFTQTDCLTIDDIFAMKFLNKESSRMRIPLVEYNKSSFIYSPITFDLESSNFFVNSADQISNSMLDLRLKKIKKDKIEMISKHKSLLDMANFKCIYVKKSGGLKLKDSGPRLNYSLPRMSRLQAIKCYINRLGEKFRAIIREVFSNRHKGPTKTSDLYPIREESYDIIELESSILKQ